MKRAAILTVIAIILGFGTWAANPADATTMYVNEYLGISGMSVTGYSNGMAGEFQLGIGSSSNNSVGYCVELTQSVTLGSSYSNYTFTSASSAALKYQLGAWIMENYSPELGNTSWYGSNSAEVAMAAVQLATWEVVNETKKTTQYSLSNGNFTMTSDPTGGVAKSLANTILSNMYTDLYSGGHYSVSASSISNISYAQSSTNQDLLVASKVPEPGSAILIVMGLLGIAWARKFKTVRVTSA